MRGTQSRIHLALATEIAPNQFQFTVPKEFHQVWTIGLVRTAPLKLAFLNMPPLMIDKYKVRKGGYFQIIMSKTPTGFITGADAWPKITNFNSL